ncbi:hypothetical protein CDL15_Pgr003041 [Punica granatum]|uniref:Uncharacterized protein n=1 Tax=Punica granatum TaxID=22663 RepID=A0A218X2I1_PUNGR|nr:hypothetical protein CDL15_Pgr003041 [Punica granatum]
MSPFAAGLSRHYLSLSRLMAVPGKSSSLCAHTTRVPVQLSGFRSSSSSSQACSFPANSARAVVLNHSGRPEAVHGPLCFDHFLRFSAASDVGSSGAGGYGGSGDGNSGGRGGGGDGGAGGESSGGNNWSFLSWYLSVLAKYPVWTKAITSALLTFIGDLVCQVVIDQLPSLNLKRLFLFTFLGLVLVGPTLHFWYLFLSKLITVPGTSGALMRLLLDQFVFSPIFIGVFLSTLITLEGRPAQVVPKLQQEWFSAVVANWQLWIPFQFLNFRFVPQQFQDCHITALATKQSIQDRMDLPVNFPLDAA